jgi:hypothetical protein
VGIVALDNITGQAPEMTGGCADFAQSSMGGGIVVRAEVGLVERFPVSLLFKEMRVDGCLKQSTYIRCNFRGICFRVSGYEYVQIRRLIGSKCVIQFKSR